MSHPLPRACAARTSSTFISQRCTQLKHTPTAAGAALTRALRQLCWRLGISEAELKLMTEEQPLNDADLLNLSPAAQWRSSTSMHRSVVP